MKNEDMLIIGDKVDLLGHQNRLYRTMIEDVTEARYFLAGVPRFGGVPMSIHQGESVFMIFYRESGRFIVEMEVVRFEHRGDVRYIWLYQKTAPVKNQRRDAFRVPKIFDVCVYEYAEKMETKLTSEEGAEADTEADAEAEAKAEAKAEVVERTSSRDISLTGIAMISAKKYEKGEKFLLKLFLDWPSGDIQPFSTCAEVKRTYPWKDSGKFVVGMNFFGHTKEMSELIAKYVLEEQRRQLKQKRLIEN